MGNKGKIPKEAKKVFTGKFFDVYQWQQQMFDGSKALYERVKRPDSAVIIPVAGDNILIEKQEQPARPSPYISLPAGMVEEGEDPLEAAKRELLEETGYTSDDWMLWQQTQFSEKIIWTSHMFIARDCRKQKEQNLEPGERIELQFLSFDDFLLLSEEPTFSELEAIPHLLRAQLHAEEREKLKKLLNL